MSVSISLRGEGIAALENERASLYSESVSISKQQRDILSEATENLRRLSRKHEVVLARIDALDAAISNLIGVPHDR